MTTHHDYTSMNHPQSFATEEEEDVHFYQTYSDGGASGDDYGSASPPQHSPTEDIDFGIPESCRSAILPATFNYSQHDNIGGPQSSPQVQPPHQPSTQLPANKRLKPGRPFNRVSKAGKHHLVTPAGACALLRCSFTKNGQPCTSEASLPSTMREHLIEEHMEFSPFQCSTCKRIFTRLALETRHLQTKKGGERTCPNQPQGVDDNYQARCKVRDALWGIQTQQDEVNVAVALIKQYNGQLESRKRRGQPRGDSTLTAYQSIPPGSGTIQPTIRHSHSYSQPLSRHHSHSPNRNPARGPTFPDFSSFHQQPQSHQPHQHQPHQHQATNEWPQPQQQQHRDLPVGQVYPHQFLPPSSGADTSTNNLYRRDFH
ncbi:hypothetical protein BZA05DRAFT_103643 [Tricharina praecox]|uniref:uncharacterized protein n=1 Tax=Tricharina praecox TaxID=43433 RepID=UPI00221F7EF8|nr:uncharacterized protein BZA05DRAFT_103643 [Tricharina praecox]KAI5857698.1 hypothetical protein BZA05DRAFT_103643 [Tricharina praecox]